MKARVTVSLKRSVLDPQGRAIHKALSSHGITIVEDVRQDKVFDISLAAGADRVAAQQQLEQIAEEILANPVIEDYRVEVLD